MKKLTAILILIVFILIGIVFTEWFGISWSNNTLYENCQGSLIKYNSYDPYCLRVIKQSHTLSSDYIILVSRKDDVNYGHVVYYPDATSLSEEGIKSCNTVWSENGVELSLKTGHKLFIPKESFIGGR